MYMAQDHPIETRTAGSVFSPLVIVSIFTIMSADVCAAQSPDDPSKTQATCPDSNVKFIPALSFKPPFCPVAFAGVNFLGVRHRADAASITNGVVRVTNDDNVTYGAGGMLPLSIPFLNSQDKVKNPLFGRFPFIGGIATTNGGTIGSLVAGEAVLIPLQVTSPGTSSSGASTPPGHLAIGLAASLTFNVQTLGDGFQPNQPPPSGATQVAYQTRTAPGFMLTITYIPF